MVKNGAFDGFGVLEEIQTSKTYKGYFKDGKLEKHDMSIDLNTLYQYEQEELENHLKSQQLFSNDI